MSSVLDAPLTTPDFAAIKQRQQATWASGDYAVVGTTLQIVGESLAEAVDVRAGEQRARRRRRQRQRDAGRGAPLRRRHLDRLRAGAARQGPRARAAPRVWACNSGRPTPRTCPSPTPASTSCCRPSASMFTPDHARTAREMLRVLRPGGRIGLANWTPEGFIGRLFKVIGAHVPPPAGVKPPALWGTEAHIADLFGAKARTIRCERRIFNFRYRSAAHFLAGVPRLLRPDAQGLRRARREWQAGAGARHHGAARADEHRRRGVAGRAERVPRSRHHQTLRRAMNRKIDLVYCASLLLMACASPSVVDVPDTLKPGANESLAMIVPAKGVQIYECRAKKDAGAGFEWAFVAPEAELFDRARQERSAGTARGRTGKPPTAAASSQR